MLWEIENEEASLTGVPRRRIKEESPTSAKYPEAETAFLSAHEALPGAHGSGTEIEAAPHFSLSRSHVNANNAKYSAY